MKGSGTLTRGQISPCNEPCHGCATPQEQHKGLWMKHAAHSSCGHDTLCLGCTKGTAAPAGVGGGGMMENRHQPRGAPKSRTAGQVAKPCLTPTEVHGTTAARDVPCAPMSTKPECTPPTEVHDTTAARVVPRRRRNRSARRRRSVHDTTAARGRVPCSEVDETGVHAAGSHGPSPGHQGPSQVPEVRRGPARSQPGPSQVPRGPQVPREPPGTAECGRGRRLYHKPPAFHISGCHHEQAEVA